MESPIARALLLVIFFAGAHHAETARRVLWALWIAHYGHRSLVYPLRTKCRGKRLPVVIVLFALAFNVVNATMNASWISRARPLSGRLAHGPGRFLVERRPLLREWMLVNFDADRPGLFALRGEQESRYVDSLAALSTSGSAARTTSARSSSGSVGPSRAGRSAVRRSRSTPSRTSRRAPPRTTSGTGAPSTNTRGDGGRSSRSSGDAQGAQHRMPTSVPAKLL